MLEPRGPLSERDVYALLSSDAREWPHKVGVAGRLDGSGKSTTRLLAASRWVMKTDLARGSSSWETARTQLEAEREMGTTAQVWHPQKRWALFRVGDTFYPLTLCRELAVLRGLEEVEARFEGWLDMFKLALHVATRFGFGLDLNPANFGRAPDDLTLYYVDDELYPAFSPQQLAFAAVARIPEEPAVPVERWLRFGESLGELLRAARTAIDRESILSALADYPITERFEPARAALCEGTARALGRASRCPAREVVCLLGDVHANLPALEAVLAEARALGANRYLFLGDAVGYGPHPKQCIARLAELPNATLLCGNHDHLIARGRVDHGMNGLARECAEWTIGELGSAELDWLERLLLEHREGDWLAVHGAPRDPRRLFAYVYDLTYDDNLRWLGEHGLSLGIHGHSHVQGAYVERAAGCGRFRGETLELSSVRRCLFNPGSVGQPRDHDARAGFALFEPAAGRLTSMRVAYPVDVTLAAIERAGLPREAGRRLLSGA